jgi:hypothetical protein
MAKITNPTAAERQAEVRQRLLLALKVITDRRRSLSGNDLELLGLYNADDNWEAVLNRCETILVEAILAGGYY